MAMLYTSSAIHDMTEVQSSYTAYWRLSYIQQQTSFIIILCFLAAI